MKNQEFKEKFRENLKKYFDLEYDINLYGNKFDMVGKFNQRSSKYVVFPKSELYAFQNNEYIFYNDVKNLTQSNILHLKNFLNENILNLVKADNEHMSSVITFVLCGDINLDNPLIKSIQKFKYYKSFAFGFKGWVNSKLIFINPVTEKVYTNKFGKGDRKRLLKLVKSEKL